MMTAGRGSWSSPATSTPFTSLPGRRRTAWYRYCWAHIRRYFVRAGDANPAQLKYWTAAWLERIRNLYAAHETLMSAWECAAAPAPREAAAAAARLEEAWTAWDEALAVIDEARKKQMQAPGLQEPAKKALATLDREWDGLAAHRGYPMISLEALPPNAPCACPSGPGRTPTVPGTANPPGSPPASGP